MKQPKDITFSARYLIDTRGDFNPWDGHEWSYADAAFDDLRSLPPRGEPIILRVTGTGFGRRLPGIPGDWLCDGSLSDQPVLIPRVGTGLTRISSARGSKPWLDVWETRTRGDVMFRSLDGVKSCVVAKASLAIARELLPFSDERDADERVLRLAENYCAGEIGMEPVIEAVNQGYRRVRVSGGLVAVASQSALATHSIAQLASVVFVKGTGTVAAWGTERINEVDSRYTQAWVADMIRANIPVIEALRNHIKKYESVEP